MSRKTKRQQQVSKLPRKKGRYIFQKTATEEIVESETDGKIVGEAFEVDETIEMEEESVNYWTEEELKEFEEVGNRLITEALRWHENAANNIRAAYTEDSRTTIWRNKNKKKELEHDAKGMKTLDTFFKSTEASTSVFSSQSSQLFPKSSSPFPKTMQSSLTSVEIIKNLQIRLEEIDQQCLISKSAKTNCNIFTYDYLRCLSICK